MIVVQYVGRAGRRPTAVAHVEAGSFVAKGSPDRRFDYVVFNGGTERWRTAVRLADAPGPRAREQALTSTRGR